MRYTGGSILKRGKRIAPMMMGKMCGLHKLAYALVWVGALNWGLVGAFGEMGNLVHLLVGSWPMVERLVYILVGASALLMLLVGSCKPCKECMMEKK